ncbi:MAG: hypothetical protein M0R46_16750 [Candidatus Muirbacterium halophilum]|nr:hypothetical protein [Candidatus Muirbacterium halophilum]
MKLNSFIIIYNENINKVLSLLYALEYTINELKCYKNNELIDCIIAYGNVSDDDLRFETISLLNKLKIEYAIISYNGKIYKIKGDGSEIPVSIDYSNIDNDISYISNFTRFSFIEEKRFWKPKRKEDFRAGMIIEYFNDNNWKEKVVTNPHEEYEKLYKLLIKYDKIRVAI